MSVAEIIEQIKALPPGEKAKVVEFLRQYELKAGTEARIEEDALLKKAAEVASPAHDDVVRKLEQ